MGAIGTAVARRASGFGMTLLYTGRSRKPALETELGLNWVELDDLLRRSDMVSLHCALTPDTRGMIAARELALMQPAAVLVNTARGGLIDTAAIVSALQAGRLVGAALDVTDPEPLPLDHPLFTFPNVVLTPHTGYSSTETLTEMTAVAVTNLLDALGGRTPQWVAPPV